jgi:hypothetical protein
MKSPSLRFLGPAIPLLSWSTARYIAHHRDRFRLQAAPIPSPQRKDLAGFFPDRLLRDTRILEGAVPEPWFYRWVGACGVSNFPNPVDIGAITFVDLILYPDQLTQPTLFHELVHVAQYRVLGLRRFARLYVEGFLRAGGYPAIPLEVQAYELEARYTANPLRPFPVIEDVERRLKSGAL